MRPTPALLRDAAERLAAAGVENPRLDARLLLAQALGTTRDALPGDIVLSDADRAAFDALLARRAAREPLAYIAGVKEFWSLDFTVGPGVLVPRPESETLIEALLKEFHDRTARLEILDLGIGSGALLFSALSEYPHARGLGVDASAAALAFAAHNRIAHGLEGRSALRHADWSETTGAFDAILANPPYIARADLASLALEIGFEPRAALDGGEDGLDAYRGLATLTAKLLRPEGRAFVEIGMGQADTVPPVFAAVGLAARQTMPDLGGIPRCLVLKRAKKQLESPHTIR